jgi:hypothetical protein
MISDLLCGISEMATLVSGVPVGSTDYLDLVKPEHFAGCRTPHMLIRGTDRFGRPFFSLYLHIKTDPALTQERGYREPGVQVDCIYTFFQRYTDLPDKVVFCSSHYKPDGKFLLCDVVGKKSGCTVEKDECVMFKNVIAALLKGEWVYSEDRRTKTRMYF